jgi:hypothetical protein
VKLKLPTRPHPGRWLDFFVDDPSETDCHGAILRICEVRISVTWPTREAK